MNDIIQTIADNTHIVRRLGSGLIVIIASYVFVFLYLFELSGSDSRTPQILSDPTFAITIVVISAYIFGSAIDAFGHIFFQRFAAAIITSFNKPRQLMGWIPNPMRFFLLVLWWFAISPYAFIYYLIRFFATSEKFDLKIDAMLDTDTLVIFSGLRASVRNGLGRLCDPNTDLAINEMMLRIDEERGNFVKKIRENNGNIVAFVTALLLSMVIAQICFSIKGDAATDQPMLMIGGMFLISVLFSIVYLQSRKRFLAHLIENYCNSIDQDRFSSTAAVAKRTSRLSMSSSKLGKVVQKFVFWAFIFGNALNILRWYFSESAQGTLEFGAFYHSLLTKFENPILLYLVEGEKLSFVITWFHWAFIYSLFAYLFMKLTWGNRKIRPEFIAYAAAVVFIAYFIAGLVSQWLYAFLDSRVPDGNLAGVMRNALRYSLFVVLLLEFYEHWQLKGLGQSHTRVGYLRKFKIFSSLVIALIVLIGMASLLDFGSINVADTFGLGSLYSIIVSLGPFLALVLGALWLSEDVRRDAGLNPSKVVWTMLYVVFLQWVFTQLSLSIGGGIGSSGLDFYIEYPLRFYLGSYIADALCFVAIYPIVAPIIYRVKRDLITASSAD